MRIYLATSAGLAIALAVGIGELAVAKARGVQSRNGGSVVTESKPQLFVVECRHGHGPSTTFFIPAFNAEEAILSSRQSAHDARLHDPTVPDPYEHAENLEIRVGTFDPSDPTKIIFGEWSRRKLR